MSRRDATSLKPPSRPAKLDPGYQFSPNFVSWCANCEHPFHYFEANSCSFIYETSAQNLHKSNQQPSIIVGFYCPTCEEILAQAQPIFTLQEREKGPKEEAGLVEEWDYPTDEEFENALDWAAERV